MILDFEGRVGGGFRFLLVNCLRVVVPRITKFGLAQRINLDPV
jgi:hypothetical protein